MKKTYSTPNSEVIKIGTIQMLADSLGKSTADPINPTGNTNILGRENDDEW